MHRRDTGDPGGLGPRQRWCERDGPPDHGEPSERAWSRNHKQSRRADSRAGRGAGLPSPRQWRILPSSEIFRIGCMTAITMKPTAMAIVTMMIGSSRLVTFWVVIETSSS